MPKNPDSIFFRSIRGFFVSLFVVVGAFIGLLVAIVLISGIFAIFEEETFSSDVKLMPDANGSRKELSHSTPILLYIPIHGEIGREDLTAAKIENLLLKTQEDDLKGRVKGILLGINSPGGDVNDTDIIYRNILEYKERHKIPIMAFVDGFAASGGYYIACATDKIVASDVSIVGSIGVISWPPFYNVVDLLKKVGIETLTLKAGEGKDDLNPTRVWKPDESKSHQELIEFFYGRFVDIVSKGRPQISKEKLINDFGAHVFPTPLAQKYGFIDGSNYTYTTAIKELSEMAKVEKYQVVKLETKEWFKKLFKEQSFLFSGKIKHEIKLPKCLEEDSSRFKYIVN